MGIEDRSGTEWNDELLSIYADTLRTHPSLTPEQFLADHAGAPDELRSFLDTAFTLYRVLGHLPRGERRSVLRLDGEQLEDGDLAPWSTNAVQASLSSVRAHGGSYSLAESGGGTMYQDINGLEPGRTYTLSAWVSAAPTATVQLVVYNPSDNTSVVSPVMRADPAWQLVSRTFTVGREGAVRIHLSRSPGVNVVYWDDVHISAQ